jgi:hypothetical protein
MTGLDHLIGRNSTARVLSTSATAADHFLIGNVKLRECPNNNSNDYNDLKQIYGSTREAQLLRSAPGKRTDRNRNVSVIGAFTPQAPGSIHSHDGRWFVGVQIHHSLTICAGSLAAL